MKMKGRTAFYLPYRYSADAGIQNPRSCTCTDFTHKKEPFLPVNTVCLHHFPVNSINYNKNDYTQRNGSFQKSAETKH